MLCCGAACRSIGCWEGQNEGVSYRQRCKGPSLALGLPGRSPRALLARCVGPTLCGPWRAPQVLALRDEHIRVLQDEQQVGREGGAVEKELWRIQGVLMRRQLTCVPHLLGLIGVWGHSQWRCRSTGCGSRVPPPVPAQLRPAPPPAG